MPFKDYFQTLRVTRHSSSQQIQRAYYERLKFFHPDFFENDASRRAIAELETKCLNEAYEVLGKPLDRERYAREWDRHQNPLRPPELTSALERSVVEVKAELATARQQVLDLQASVDQRTRELDSAHRSIRQGHERMQQLQHNLEAYQDSARQLESRLLERNIELQQLQARADSWQSQVRQLEGMLADFRREAQQASDQSEAYRRRVRELDAALLERRLEVDQLQQAARNSAPPDHAYVRDRLADASPDANSDAPGEGGSAGTPADTAPLSQSPTDGVERAVADLERQLGVAQAKLQEQQLLLEEAARQVKTWQSRAQAAEEGSRQAGLSADQDVEPTDQQQREVERLRDQIRELSAALAERTEEVQRTRHQLEAEKEQVRSREAASSVGRTMWFAGALGWRGLVGTRLDTAASWLNPQRATAIMTVLLLALCGMAIALIVLTVSLDIQALLSGLGRLGSSLTSFVPR